MRVVVLVKIQSKLNWAQCSKLFKQTVSGVIYHQSEFKMSPLPIQQDDLCDIIMYHNPNSEQHHKTDKIQNDSNTQTQIQQKGYVNTPLSRSFLLSSWVSLNVNIVFIKLSNIIFHLRCWGNMSQSYNLWMSNMTLSSWSLGWLELTWNNLFN